MRPMTATEKIIARAAGVREVAPGDEVWASLDLVLMNDSSGPRRMAPVLERLGGKLWNPDRVVLAVDHFVPAANERYAEILATNRRWAAEQGLKQFYDFEGIFHSLALERFLALPGILIAGADSHTNQAGAVGAMAVGISSTELATILATGQMWLRVPPTLQVQLEGRFQPGVAARDITMQILGRWGQQWALYKAIEYVGPAVAGLSLAERAVLSNQGVEMGAKNAIVPADDRLLREIEAAGVLLPYEVPRSDPDAVYESSRAIDLPALEPMVACPHEVDNVRRAADLGDARVDAAYIGYCTSGGQADLEAAATILKGKRSRARLSIIPSSRQVYRACLRNGTFDTLVEAGATILPPSCGACLGLHSGILASGERAISTGTRNFKGRMGSPDAEVYLGSPLTVAASALAGRIVDPREVL